MVIVYRSHRKAIKSLKELPEQISLLILGYFIPEKKKERADLEITPRNQAPVEKNSFSRSNRAARAVEKRPSESLSG